SERFLDGICRQEFENGSPPRVFFSWRAVNLADQKRHSKLSVDARTYLVHRLSTRQSPKESALHAAAMLHSIDSGAPWSPGSRMLNTSPTENRRQAYDRRGRRMPWTAV